MKLPSVFWIVVCERDSGETYSLGTEKPCIFECPPLTYDQACKRASGLGNKYGRVMVLPVRVLSHDEIRTQFGDEMYPSTANQCNTFTPDKEL